MDVIGYGEVDMVCLSRGHTLENQRRQLDKECVGKIKQEIYRWMKYSFSPPAILPSSIPVIPGLWGRIEEVQHETSHAILLSFWWVSRQVSSLTMKAVVQGINQEDGQPQLRQQFIIFTQSWVH